MPKFLLESLRYRLHDLLRGEIRALEGAGRTVGRVGDDVPWAYTMHMARQVWDASRHVDICLKLLEHVGEDPASTLLGRRTGVHTSAEGAAGGSHALTDLASDGFSELISLARQIGDPHIERAVDYVLADKLTHVYIQSRWLPELTEPASDGRQKALQGQKAKRYAPA